MKFFKGFLLVFLLHLAGCGLAMNSEDRLDRAEQAIGAGDYRAAIIDTKDVLRKEPENVRGRVLLGRASIRANDAAAAEKEFRRALELGEDPASIAVDLGRALLMLGKFEQILEEINFDYAASNEELIQIYKLHGDALVGLRRPDEARDVYSRVLEIDENDTGAKLGIVSSYLSERNVVQARATLDQVLADDTESVEAWSMSGQLYFDSRNAELAELHFDKALTLAVGEADSRAEARALVGLGDALLVQNKTDSARTISERLMALSPNMLGAMQLSARIAYIDEDWERAQSLLQQVLLQLPDYRPAQLLLGAVHLKNGNLEQAEMYLSAVVAAVPENADARNLLAQTRLQQKDTKAAQELLQPILDGSAPNANSLAMAAQASFGAGDLEQATTYLERRVAAIPDDSKAQLDLAAMYLMTDRADDAQAILETANFDDGDANEFRRDMLSVLSLVRASNVPAALAAAQVTKEQWPDSSRALTLLGWVQMIGGDAPAAHESYLAAAGKGPNDQLPLRLLASIEEEAGNFVDAKSRYRQIVEIYPDDLASLMALARLSAREEDRGDARHWLEKAVAAEPSNIKNRNILGQMLLALGDFEAARELAEASIRLSANDAESHRILGHALLNLDEFDSSKRSLEDAIALDSSNSAYWLALAKAQVDSGDRDAAKNTISQAYAENPEDIQIAVLLASIMVNNNDLDAALIIARELREAHPDNAAPISLHAEILSRKGQLSEAATLYDQVLSLNNSARFAARAYQLRDAAGRADKNQPLKTYLEQNPLNTSIRIFLAQDYQVDGNDENAISEYQRVLEIAPDDPIALNNLAWMYLTSGDSRAEELARRAYDISPENASVVDTLGWILVEKGEAEDGVRLLREAVEKSDNRPVIRYHLASGLAELGRDDEAKEILEAVLNEPGDFSSRSAAEELLLTL